MRVLVCGSRTWTDQYPILWALRALRIDYREELVVIEGGAAGADTCAREAADRLSVWRQQFPADWQRYGKAAGPIRNQQMLDDAPIDVVLAFVDKPLAESAGTADMVARAESAGVPVYVIEKRRPTP